MFFTLFALTSPLKTTKQVGEWKGILVWDNTKAGGQEARKLKGCASFHSWCLYSYFSYQTHTYPLLRTTCSSIHFTHIEVLDFSLSFNEEELAKSSFPLRSDNMQGKNGGGRALSTLIMNKHGNFPNQLRAKEVQENKYHGTMDISRDNQPLLWDTKQNQILKSFPR